ncbi:ABC transporter ATP-binding protein [Eubacterium aggregans]|uniref:ABC transporter ATP-binding protein n=1 Tax=Eubacterium aggregans TaxID=81409 RepID=UPI003F3C688B
MNDNLLSCIGLTKHFCNQTALDDLTLNIGKGRIVGLLGPNGSGKTTLIKLATGLLTPTEGTILIGVEVPSVETKAQVSYLPERTYFHESMTVPKIITCFSDFYQDFEAVRAMEMVKDLGIDMTAALKNMSKGTKEKVQLIMVMSRRAKLYLLDEPIGGVDPAARDYILNTIIGNYNSEATVVISTHLIVNVEKVLDEVIFIRNGNFVLQESVDDIREKRGCSVGTLFREEFRC